MTTAIRLLLVVLLFHIAPALAAIEVYEFDSPQQEAQFYGLIEDLRCPTCQNQNLASSDAPIAQDLKQKTYEMVKEGRTDSEIRDYMFERYGDFISYKPPVRPSTWILWFFPPILLLTLLIGWIYRMLKKPTSLANVSKPEKTTLSESEKERLERILDTHQPNQTAKAIIVNNKTPDGTGDEL